MGLAEIILLNRRIASCQEALKRTTSEWGKEFWQGVIEKLLDNVNKH